MSQLIDSLPNEQNTRLLCCYVNATDRIQVARITNIPNWYFERVVFPGQRLVFEAIPQALLEIHCGMMASAILSDRIPCERLCIEEAKEDTNNSSLTQKASLDHSKTNHNNFVDRSNTKQIVSV
ncbi:MAG: DUF1830 domain-containing protein [Xenococcaceae cyanobacterium MO_207.B15]|nr:DUF1830 domain-containing protein [Xenococcaceae cyanobacterium MO_207.B15]MDJ0744712.1 DUF1830 domain-containing protein [Xenococcaceae cyanobacterium MO_167.B27]